ncbi:MAG: tetratricopeptide repeat protein [Pseudomonadota bacterium]|nr:tetratricopeptide repeat protein [Pseudomonadota bacterium]
MADAPRPGVALAALLVLVLVVYGPSLGYAYVWDDGALIAENPYIRQPLDLAGIFGSDFWARSSTPRASGMYRPLVTLAYWAEWRLWGGGPAGFHAVNVLLHLASTTAVATLGRRLGLPGLAPVAAAALFALHPVTVEAVANIASRTDLMATALVLAGVLVWLREDRLRWAAAPLLLGATLCKETGVVGPLLAVLAARARGRAALGEEIALVAGVLAPWFALRASAVGSVALEGTSAGGARAVYFAGRLLWPDFAAPNAVLAPPATWWAVVTLAGFAAAVGAAVRTPGPVRVGAALATFALLPVLEIVPVGARASDLLLYLPLAGLGLALAARIPAPPLLGLALVLAAVSAARLPVWSDSAHIWAATYAQRPDDPLAQLNLGRVRAGEGDAAAAERLYGEVLAGDGDVDLRVRAAYNLGNLLREAGRSAEAAARYEEALRLSNRQFPRALYNLAVLAGEAGRRDEAVTYARELVQRWPDQGAHWSLLGVQAAQASDWGTAIEAFDRAVSLDPTDAESARMRTLAKARAAEAGGP